mgnify:CR=1 FL=1
MIRETRIRLILRQLESGPMTTRQIGGALFMDLTTVSHDLTALYQENRLSRVPAPYGTKGGKFVWSIREEHAA